MVESISDSDSVSFFYTGDAYSKLYCREIYIRNNKYPLYILVFVCKNKSSIDGKEFINR